MCGALEPPPGNSPAFAQLYVLDNHAIVDVVKGMQFGAKLNANLLESLADMLKAENAYVRESKAAAALDVPQCASAGGQAVRRGVTIGRGRQR